MKTKEPCELRLTLVKVGLTKREAAAIDMRRGHYGRSEFLRAAGLDAQLVAAPNVAAVTTWAESARVQACFTQINDIAYALNVRRQNEGLDAAASELMSKSAEVLATFKEFREQIFLGLQPTNK